MKNNNDNYNKILDFQLLSNLTKDSFSRYYLDNTFCIFKSINDIFYLIYSNKNTSIIAFNIINNTKIIEIKNAHNKNITNFRHYLDDNNKKDLIISLSADDNNLKLWNVNNFECILNIKNINKKGFLYSACFLNDNNHIYIITSNFNYYGDFEYIKIFDLNGNKIKIINDSNKETYFIDTYYNREINKIYIISGNKEYSISYDYEKNQIYYKYYNNDFNGHCDNIIICDEGIIKLIESSYDSYIRIFDFNSGEMIKKININNQYLGGICLWNKNYLLVGGSDCIIIMDMNNGKIIRKLIGNKYEVINIKKIVHPKYGECLVSQGILNEQIKIWVDRKYINN